ncbi:MAG: adenosine deaminase [Cyanobacteria bacterium HKST-UBA04]|nr:adenosine deaminase [Cyanobacteria bacterium HKST-UBA04]
MNQTRLHLIETLPKTELHLHIEGTLMPEMMFALARKNGVALPYASVAEVAAAYAFDDLQSFLNLYYEGMAVLQHRQDFYDLTMAYLQRMADEAVVHVEIFFDPQAHTRRGVSFETVIGGITDALKDGQARLGISYRLIMCFLRDLGEAEALATWQAAQPFLALIDGVGLDSAEVGHPPEAFQAVYQMALDAGLKTVAHAGEEGPPEYIWNALNDLKVSRIDHGVRALEDPELVAHLVHTQVPLTVCPLSNIKLRVFDDMGQHNLKSLLEAGVCVTINSDDPAYFGGYLVENFVQTADALGLSDAQVVQLVKNGFVASDLPDAEKAGYLQRIDALAAQVV